MMHVLLFVFHVCMLRECEGDGNDDVGDGVGVVAVSAGCECMSGTRGLRGEGGVCEMCMWLAQSGVGGERIGFGLYQSCRNKGSVGHVFGVRRFVMLVEGSV